MKKKKNQIHFVPSYTGITIGRLEALAERRVGSKEELHVEAENILLEALRELGGFRCAHVADAFEAIRERLGFGYSAKDPVFEVKKNGNPKKTS